jgi:DME family drug/metabolite transporter
MRTRPDEPPGVGGDGAQSAQIVEQSLGMGPRALVLLAALCFGTTGTAQALGPDSLQPLAVGAGRVVVGGALLVAVLALTRSHRWRGDARIPDTSPPSTHRDRGTGRWIALAALGVAAYQLCFFAAVDRTGVAVGTVVALGSAPAVTGLLAAVVDRARPGRTWAAATALAVAGTALIATAGGGASVSAGGVLLALGAGTSYAVFTVAGKRLLDAGQRTESVMAWAFGAGAVLLLPVLALADRDGLASPGGLAVVLWLGAVPTALAYLLFASGLRRLPASEVATLTLAEPVTATVLGVAVLAERPGPAAVAGVGLVLAGLLLLARGSAPPVRAVAA